jgi:predicted membrane metal-binding protein
MCTGITQLLMVSAVVMGLSQTVTRERIFEPLRSRLGGKETWLGYLVSCPYCLSHAIAFVLVPLTGTYAIGVVVGPGWVADVLRWFLSSILVTVIAAFLRVAFWFVDERQALVRREKQLVETEVSDQTRNRSKE